MNTLHSVMKFIDINSLSIHVFEQNTHLSEGTLEKHWQKSTDLSNKEVNRIICRYGSDFVELGFFILEGDRGREKDYTIMERDLNTVFFGGHDQ